MLARLLVYVKDATREKPDGRDAQGEVRLKGHRASTSSPGGTTLDALRIPWSGDIYGGLVTQA